MIFIKPNSILAGLIVSIILTGCGGLSNNGDKRPKPDNNSKIEDTGALTKIKEKENTTMMGNITPTSDSKPENLALQSWFPRPHSYENC